VRQSEHRLQMRRALEQSSVARLLIAEVVLDIVKRVLNLGAHTYLELFELLAQPSGFGDRQGLALTRTRRNVPLNCAALILTLALNTLNARIT